MKYPRVQFKVDPREDINVYFSIEKDAMWSNDWTIMKKRFWDLHPGLLINETEKNRDKKEKIVSNVVFNYYNKHSDLLAKDAKVISARWDQIRNQYYELVSGLFGERKWPKGEYIGFITMWGIYPRFIDRKVFQVPNSIRGKMFGRVEAVIAHEMLHFMFYDYLYEWQPRYKKEKYNYMIWIISEAFNEAVMNEDEWIVLFPKQGEIYNETASVRKLIIKLRKAGLGLDSILKQCLDYCNPKYLKPDIN